MDRAAGVGGILCAKAIAERFARASLQRVEPLDGRQLPGLARLGAGAETMHVLEFLEEENGILDAVHAEFQRVDILRPHGNDRLLTRGEGLAGGEREVGLCDILRRGGQEGNARGNRIVSPILEVYSESGAMWSEVVCAGSIVPAAEGMWTDAGI